MTNVRRVKRGETLAGLPGDTWNAFCDVYDAHKEGGRLGAFGEGAERIPGLLRVRNDSGLTRNVGEVFGVDSIDLDQQNQIVASGIDPLADQWRGTFAVAITPSVDGAISLCCIMGLCRAVVNVTDTEIDTADITATDGTKLTSHLAGRARLVIPATATGEQDAWVLLGGPRQLYYTGVAPSGITAGATGSVEIDGYTSVSVTAHLDKMHSSENISAAREVGIKWMDSEQLWRVLNAECEA